MNGCNQKSEDRTLKQSSVKKITIESIERPGFINVEANDNNKDGKEYQCPTDVNVIKYK